MSMKNLVRLLFLTLVLSFNSFQCKYQCEALEATWTPNENEGNGGNSGPLPLSQNQRQQLLQLEQTISQSPDPEGTLRHIAQQNQMSPEDLVSMLQQNRRDLEHANGAATASMANRASATLPRKLVNLISALFVMMVRYATMHPKGFSMVFLTVMLLGYGVITAPQTGIVLSGSNSLISNGHTTLFVPPTEYIQKYLSDRLTGKRRQASISKTGLSRGRKDILLELFDQYETNGDEEDEEYQEYLGDGVQFHLTGRKANNDHEKNLILSVSSRKTIPLDSLISKSMYHKISLPTHFMIESNY